MHRLCSISALPVRGPKIEILDSNGRAKSPKTQEISYSVGDKIELRCNSSPSKPAARLRWYLNDMELSVPMAQQTSGSSVGQHRNETAQANRTKRASGSTTISGYDVRVTPIEHRLHYKAIYSSHSTLSLILQRDNLINNKISFKCLASMRQEIPVQSKQLIVLQATRLASQRAKRQASPSGSHYSHTPQQHPDLYGSNANEAHPTHRQTHHTRPQTYDNNKWANRFGAPNSATTRQQDPTSSYNAAIESSANRIASSLFASNAELATSNALYIYEPSDSTLGPNMIENYNNLEYHLRPLKSTHYNNNNFSEILASLMDVSTSSLSLLSSNRAKVDIVTKFDNSEHIQALRNQLSRHRSSIVASGQQQSTRTRFHGLNSLVKSPLLLDELDPLRPVISWPPLESGQLLAINHLNEPTNRKRASGSIVAIPTAGSKFSTNDIANDGHSQQQVFLSPASMSNIIEQSTYKRATLFETLAQNLNCTCAEYSTDTKLTWFVDESPVEPRSVQIYPTRMGLDHRQSQPIIGFNINNLPFHHKHTPIEQLSNSGGHFERVSAQSSASHQDNQQLKLACIAVHSMLLYSSSEMITFDFSPSQIGQDENSILDRLASSSSSNVIQATSGK